MAYIRKLKSGYRAEVERRGIRDSQTFATKAAATAWAAKREAEILDGAASKWPRKTLKEALQKYELEVTPGKGSAKFEKHAFGMMLSKHKALCDKIISEITPADLSEWRDLMLKRVSGSTVQRYINIFRHVWTKAAREWMWTPEPSPWRSIQMPDQAPPRDRLIHWREARRILRRLNFKTGREPKTKGEQVAWAFLVALRTGMRASEILSLTGESISNGVATLTKHKTLKVTGKPRRVPLTKAGRRLLAALHRPGPLFDLTPSSLDAMFRKARDQVLVKGIHFHDSRATALTHLARKVDVMTLARISGHRDVSLLLNVYYRESEEAISARMA